MLSRKQTYWTLWLGLTAVLATWLGLQLFSEEQKPAFLVGQTTHGHHQIELACTSCHSTAFGGQQVLQDACMGCHGEELQVAQDSHPRSKFTDPRNADTLAVLDARFCVACHREHNARLTTAMGVTQPTDFCFLCHQDIAQERPSHSGMAFDTCGASGCHNFHDNRALYEDFLVANADGPWLDESGTTPPSEVLAYVQSRVDLPVPPALAAAPANLPNRAVIEQQWAASSHAGSNVGCGSCHSETGGGADAWIAKPAQEACATCHEIQVSTFTGGKHGMRLAAGLTPMQPALAADGADALAFTPDSHTRNLTCSACHDPHAPDTRLAAVDSCQGCHADQHSQAFTASPHGRLWQRFEAGELAANQAVSCASCHLPRQQFSSDGKTFMLAQHNQNDTLRPNDKMVRSVCMNCHSLTFALDALADTALVDNNFTGRPGHHVESIDMALERIRNPHPPSPN